ncbi:olfactomedin-like [Eublepharis macularius]|uniref:Olfactomedin-like n=1 Tax=Eublepharis macularius TaxID=481883 RepID=A0AA97IUY5_EUBMA|nr:olfactomedin-like [Eublepharis macularius]
MTHSFPLVILSIFYLPYQVIVHGGHIQKVVGVKDASGQCICSVQLSHVSFPVRKVEQLEGDYYNLTDHLQNILTKLYTFHWVVNDGRANLTDLDKRAKYAKDYGAHMDLKFDKLIKDVYTLVSTAKNISQNTTSVKNKEMINKLIDEINGIAAVIISMEERDKNNIITAQREVDTLRKKLLECEEAIALVPATVADKTVFGTCQHDGLQSVSSPVLVKLNWKGPDFKTGSWGKDFALGNKLKDHYWVFPMNKDERTLETFRLYASYKKLLLYSPIREYSLNVNSKDTCESCGQGGGVVFYNGSFFYNCYDSRALCRADPFTMQVSRVDLDDHDPASFNNWFSYKDVKYQDMDMAGDEKGLWMIHGSTMANGNIVIRKVNPDLLKVGTPWITTQPKNKLTNTFMICGVLYATKRVNSTHEQIFYYYDTNTAREGNIKILMEKLRPTVQSLNYNPNDEKLYMFNDGYLLYYNTTFKNHIQVVSRGGKVLALNHKQDSISEKGQRLMSKGAEANAGQEDQSSVSNKQLDWLSKGGSDAQLKEEQVAISAVRQETVREGNQLVDTE